jgi:hypothetical protein
VDIILYIIHGIPRLTLSSFKFGGAEGEEEGIAEAEVVGVSDEIAAILGSEGGHLNGVALKVVDETSAEAEGEVRGEIDVSGAGLREIGVEEASEVGPSPREAVLIGDMDDGWGTTILSPFVGGGGGGGGVELKIKASRLRRGGGGRSVVVVGDIDIAIK